MIMEDKLKEALKKIQEKHQAINRAKLERAINNRTMRELAYKHRLNKDTTSKDLSRRRILSVPPEVAVAAEREYGSHIWTDREELRRALRHDEVLRSFLLVPMSEV